jgi:8-oxo-dGTP pyrophosphatase MutT (NUDIX family)
MLVAYSFSSLSPFHHPTRTGLLSKFEYDIPSERLPPGFEESIMNPPAEVVVPRAAATIVLLRDSGSAAVGDGFEVLLLKRIKSAGFVPGAWVFPGGRVDADDATAELLARMDGLSPSDAARRLSLTGDADPPALAYYVAALREAFEETGILVGATEAGAAPRTAAADARVQELRLRLMRDEGALPSVLDELGCRMAGGAVEYIAHWITPVPEPRRFDTRFFAAVVPPGTEALPDPRESSDAGWFTPNRAIEENLAGRLPMVFPTIHTLRALAVFSSAEEALAAHRARDIPLILPRIVRTPTGVGIRVDE